MNNTGFVAGTLVHTDKGLVPIQDIKVGDLILSKPVSSKSEDGSGDIEYKPVLSTFKSPSKKRIFKVCLLYTSPSPRDRQKSRMPSSA